MIENFRDKEAEKIFNCQPSRKLPQSIQRTALRKLWMIHAATKIKDLRIPPGNRLESLTGKYANYFSIRSNQKWRVIFLWHQGNAREVQIIDYHQ